MPKRHMQVLANADPIDPFAVMVNAGLAIEDTPPYFLSIYNRSAEADNQLRVGPVGAVSGTVGELITTPQPNPDPEVDIPVGGQWTLNIPAGQRYAFTGDAATPTNEDVYVIVATA